MKLDRILTVAVGDHDTEGDAIPYGRWMDFQTDVTALLSYYGTVVGSAAGIGLGSDGANEGVEEQNAIFITVLHDDHSGALIRTLRARLANLIGEYGQSSACFAIDQAHEPVFNTPSGDRP